MIEMKYNIGDQVTNKITHPGQVGTIIEIDSSKKMYPYRVDFAGRPAIWHGDDELELHVEKQYQSMDISSGLGIGGVGSDDFNINSDIIGTENQQSCLWGGTRYDEECDRCGRVTEICNDCNLCEKCHERR